MPALPPVVTQLLASQHGVCTTQQLHALSFGERRIATAVRSGRLTRLHRGAYACPQYWDAATSTAQHCMRLLAVQLAVPDACAWGVTAVLAWGLPVRTIPDTPLVNRSAQAATAAGARVSRSPYNYADVIDHRGLRVVPIPVAVVETVACVDLSSGLITADAALRRGITVESLWAAVASRSSRAGAGRLRVTLEHADPGAESWLESLSRGRSIEAELPLPLCNVELRVSGRWVRVDLLWPEWGVVGECDGKGKYDDARTAAQVIWKEKRRHEWIESLGFEVARWGYPEVADNGAELRRRVERAVAIQAGAGFTWPINVAARIQMAPGVQPLPRVTTEVARLQRDGYPITVVDADGLRLV